MAEATLGYEVRVAPQLQSLLVPIDEIKPHPRNLRKHDINAIAASIAEFGQQSPVVVQKSSGFICKGNGTYAALRLLGATHIAVSYEDFDDERAWDYLLADNRTSDLADYNRDALVAALREQFDGRGLQRALWTIDDLETLEAQAGQIVIYEPDTMNAEYAATAEQLAERRAQSERIGNKMKEVAVVLTVAAYEQFMLQLAALRKEYQTSGTIATIVEAVRREAVKLGMEAPVIPDGAVRTAPEPTSEDFSEEELLARLV